MTNKPYYKVVIGDTKPVGSASLEYGNAGKLRIEVSDALEGQIGIADLVEVQWGDAIIKLAAFVAETHPYPVKLTEPEDRPLAAEAEKILAARATRATR